MKILPFALFNSIWFGFFSLTTNTCKFPLRCLILQQPMLQSIHLSRWVVLDLCHQLIGDQFLHIETNCDNTFCVFWKWFDNISICFSEVKYTCFCGKWKIQVGPSGVTSYSFVIIEFKNLLFFVCLGYCMFKFLNAFKQMVAFIFHIYQVQFRRLIQVFFFSGLGVVVCNNSANVFFIACILELVGTSSSSIWAWCLMSCLELQTETA